jgi:hypothetical protein
MTPWPSYAEAWDAGAAAGAAAGGSAGAASALGCTYAVQFVYMADRNIQGQTGTRVYRYPSPFSLRPPVIGTLAA